MGNGLNKIDSVVEKKLEKILKTTNNKYKINNYYIRSLLENDATKIAETITVDM